MNEETNREILAEMRKLRRSTQVILAIVGGVVAILCVTHEKSTKPAHSWSAVQSAVRELNYQRALSLAKANVAIQPSDYYGHSYLGIIYLSMGDVSNSEAEYSRAYELFPSEENAKGLAAVRRRLSGGLPRTNSPAAVQPETERPSKIEPH